MDFVTLATESNLLIRRLTDVITGEDASSSSSSLPASSSSSSSGLTGYHYYDGADEDIPLIGHNRPLLSKTAEAELYLLATNFLLYVAMVIIAVMVAKIYFPESLERGSLPYEHRRPQSFSYRISDTGQTDEEGLPSDDEDAKGGGNDFLDEVLDSGDEVEGEDEVEADDENEVFVDARQDTRDIGNGRPEITPRRKYYANPLEFHQESLSRVQVVKRLVFCSIMLNITFVMWGVLQERMLTRKYPRYTGEYFTYSYALVFTNRFWTLIMSGMLMLYLKPRRSQTTVLYEYSFPSISNMLSSWCQYEALRYVSFPASTIFKSFKLAPVMAMGKILGNKSYPQYDYMVALMIGIGIAMFMTSTDDLRFGYDIYGAEVSATWTGVMLLFLFLFFDSFTSQFQSRMFQRHRDLSMVELMFATSAFSTVLSFVTLIHTKELYPALSFVMQHQEIHLHFLLFSICSTIGQLFIYYTIKNFGAVVFTLIMTTRILLSIALSCVLYGHQVSSTGFFGLMLVMAAVLYRIRRKAQGQQLLKWQGMEDGAKAHELVQEWHEHVDM